MNHLGMELIASTAKIKLLHVPYQGLGPAITGLMGGQVQMLLASLPAAMPHVRAGKMRAIAVTGVQRSALMPDLPTTAEAGLPGVEIEAWWGLLGPAGLPAPIVKRLNDELNAVLGTPEIVDVLARDGATPRPGAPDAFRKVISSDVARWSKLIKEARISTE
jgi:tripartite-type tricarboxylate transporter receptor subunit TctC